MEQEVEALQDIPKIRLVGRELGPLSEGEKTQLKPWEVPTLEEHGLVESIQDFSITGVRKRIMSEEKSTQIKELPANFYMSVSYKIESLFRTGEEEKAEKLKEAMNSLVSIRIQKLSKMAASSVKPRKLPPEEMVLMNGLSRTLNIWKNRLDQIFGKNFNEEVDAPEGKIRRNIRGVVGNTADI